jgi:uncharacterized protein YbaR (Trm112 family)
MKLRLIDVIVCPACKKRFTLRVGRDERLEFSEEWKRKFGQFCEWRASRGESIDEKTLYENVSTDIVEGNLLCETCGEVYPIENGVPRLLPRELRTPSGRVGRGDPRRDPRITEFMDQIKPVSGTHNEHLFMEIQVANQSNYGFEWNAFSHEYEGWGNIYRKYYVSENPEFFRGRIGLDAGCGMGRYTLVPVSMGAEMVGLDLSNAIEVSYAKSRLIPTLHAVQGDIYNLPFRESCFDFAQSLGVIHIAPDPEQALDSIKKTVRPDEKLFIYVYPSFEDENKFKYYLLKLITQLRRATVKIPSNYLYKLLYLIVPVVLVGFYFPSWILWHIPWTRNFAEMLPYNYGQYQGRRLRDIHMNLFDRFGNPVERRYSREEMERWMTRSDFKEYKLVFRDGWSVSAVKR